MMITQSIQKPISRDVVYMQTVKIEIKSNVKENPLLYTTKNKVFTFS